MKKKIIIAVYIILVLALIVPFGFFPCNDGGTLQVSALSYTIVFWNRLYLVTHEDGSESMECHKATCIYFFPDNLKSLNELWEIKH